MRFFPDAGFIEQTSYPDTGQFRGNNVFQGSTHAPESGAHSIDNNNFSIIHFHFPSYFCKSLAPNPDPAEAEN
jgi:hypothetical protein